MAREAVMRVPLMDPSHAKNGAVGPWSGDVFVFPTTVAQQGFWYLDRVDPGNPAYNIAVRFRLQGPLDLEALGRALNEIVRRHESLRTVFAEVDGGPVQVVAPTVTIPVPRIDLRGVPESDRLARSEALAVEEARRRFDLSAGPLIRAGVLRLEDREHVLLVTVHHIVSDGWSIGLIAQELGALYDAFARGQSSPLPDLPLQYGDFAIWRRQWLEGGDLDEGLARWTRTLSGLAPLEVPTDRPRPPIQTSNGHIESSLLPRDLTEAIKGVCRREGVTFFTLALAALKVLLRRHAGTDDVHVGTLIAGRSRVELEPIIGPLINPLVLRTDLSGDPTFPDLLARVGRTVLEALAVGDVPFERVVEAVQPRRDRSRHPVFQINFIYQRDFVRPFQAAGLALSAMPSRSPGAIYDLNFFMVEREDGWRASCEYNTDLYDAATVDRLLAHFRALLEGIAADPSRRISELPMGTAADRPDPVPAVSARTLRTPGDEIEATLTGLWERLLGGTPIGLDDDFFDVGGHSLLAMRLLGQVERAFGERISLAAFLQSPTVRSVAAALREGRAETRREQVIVTHPGGSAPPFAIVDTGAYFRPLIHRLGPDQPVLGLILPELTDLPKRFDVEDIAANLIAALREVQPRGPYRLGGWCHAGVIAYEMARQLADRGEDVARVILFDTDNPRYVRQFEGLKALPVKLYLKSEKLLHHLDNLRRARKGEAVGYALQRLRTVFAGWKLAFWRFWHRGLNVAPGEHLRNSSVFQYLAVKDYEPAPIGVPIVLFRSQHLQTGRFRDPRLGWGDFARGGLDVHEVPGGHGDMFHEPAVALLTDALARSLRQGG